MIVILNVNLYDYEEIKHHESFRTQSQKGRSAILRRYTSESVPLDYPFGVDWTVLCQLSAETGGALDFGGGLLPNGWPITVEIRLRMAGRRSDNGDLPLP